MKGLLKSASYEVVDNAENASVIVVNVCTVKGDQHALAEIKKTSLENPGKKLIIAGCVTKSLLERVKAEIPDVSFLNTHNIKKIDFVVNSTLSDRPVSLISGSNEPKTGLPKVRKNPVVGIIQIATGCDSFCSFCSTKLIKGRLQSYSPSSIVQEAAECIKEGCKEIWLTATDTSCYGLDIGTNLPKLVKVLTRLDGEFMIRIGMANPKHVLRYQDELIEAISNPKVFKFLHLPVQSGNDRVLKAMKREYTVEEYKKLVSRIKKEIPEITIATDIIVGFPGETFEEFIDSVRLVEETRPDVLNISRFVPRGGTQAIRMPNQVPEIEKKMRSRLLTRVYWNVALEQNLRWLGWKGLCIIDEVGKHGTLIGRNFAYKPIVLRGTHKLGSIVEVEILAAEKFNLRDKSAIKAEV